MAARIFRINYKSDFILTMQSDAGWATPFCIKFWTGAPSIAYFAGWDGTTYVHCALDGEDPTKLHVHFDDHHLPIGDLKFQIAYHFTVEDFPNNTEDEVINQAAVIIDQDGTQMQVMLDLNGETAPEIEFNLPAYANEAQRIANENQRIANEAQRIANEEQRIANEEQRISNEEQRIAAESIRIANEESRISEFAQLKHDAEIATADANAAATLANEKAALAAEKAALSQAAAELANAKATLAQQKADYAQAQGDYAKAQGDYAKDQGNIAEADHERAESDHTRAENDHTAVEVYVDSLGAFDISAYHATGGVLAKYVDLSAALDGGDNIPEAIRKGGMSVKFVQSSDNKYVQYRLMHPLDNASTAADDFTNTANWQGVDDEPTAGSDNLVKSGGVSEKLTELEGKILLTNQKITDVEVVSDEQYGGVVPYIFESGKTYIVTNRRSGNITISHRNTPNGESSDILNIPPNATVNYTVTSNGNYLRFGGPANFLIKPSDSITNNFVEKNSVSTQQDYLGDGVTKRTLTFGDASMSFATDVICQPLSRASEISITAKKGDTFVYDITGAQGTGISIEKANNRMAEFMIPSGQTTISGTYVLTDDAVSIKALLGDIVINVAYFKNTHCDSSIETLNGKVNKTVDIKYFYNSNPNYTQSGSLLEGEYYYNINGKKLYKLQNGAGVAQTIDSNTRYFYRKTLLKWTDEDGFSPDVKVINIEAISNIFNYDTLRYVYDGEKIVWTNPLPAPFVSTAFIRFAPSKDVVYTYNDYPLVFDGIHFVLNRADNIVVENEDTLTDLSSIATSFDWSDGAINTRMSQIYSLFDSLVQQYPDYISRDNAYTVAGLEKPSYASQYETYVYHFKVVDSESTHIRPTVLLIGGTHGNEIWSALNLYCFMKQICEGATANYYNMRASFNFEVVPCLNGWGIINDSRYNGNNVDINRNFDDNWESGDNTGSEAFSEAESKLVRSLTNTYTPLCAFDLHSYWGINGAAFYSVLNNYDINQVIARRCIKDISRTLIKHLPSRFGSIGDGFYNIAMRRSAYEAGKDAYGTMAGWWSHTLRICGTIEVDNDISYNNGEYVSNGVEWRNGNALSVAEYVLRIQLFRYCASAINYMASTYFL